MTFWSNNSSESQTEAAAAARFGERGSYQAPWSRCCRWESVQIRRKTFPADIKSIMMELKTLHKNKKMWFKLYQLTISFVYTGLNGLYN